jgi:hypothetical protein
MGASVAAEEPRATGRDEPAVRFERTVRRSPRRTARDRAVPNARTHRAGGRRGSRERPNSGREDAPMRRVRDSVGLRRLRRLVLLASVRIRADLQLVMRRVARRADGAVGLRRLRRLVLLASVRIRAAVQLDARRGRTVGRRREPSTMQPHAQEARQRAETVRIPHYEPGSTVREWCAILARRCGE